MTIYEKQDILERMIIEAKTFSDLFKLRYDVRLEFNNPSYGMVTCRLWSKVIVRSWRLENE